MLTTSVKTFPVNPFFSPERMASEKVLIFFREAFTSGITSSPSTMVGRLERLRSAVWRTARPSVIFIFSPENILSIDSDRPHSAASSENNIKVSSVIRFFEKSTKRPSRLRVKLSKRLGSAANIFRRSVFWIVSLCWLSFCQLGS